MSTNSTVARDDALGVDERRELGEALVGHRHDGLVGPDRAEGIVRGLRVLRLGEGVEERGFADVREADDADRETPLQTGLASPDLGGRQVVGGAAVSARHRGARLATIPRVPGVGVIEVALITVVLWAALRPLLRVLRPDARSGLFPGLLAVAALVTWTAVVARRPPVIEAEVADRPARVGAGGYVSSDACRGLPPARVRELARVLSSYDDASGDAGDGDSRHRRRADRRRRRALHAPAAAVTTSRSRCPIRVSGSRRRRAARRASSRHDAPGRITSRTSGSRAAAIAPSRISRSCTGSRSDWLPNGATFMQPPPPADAPLATDHGGWNRNCIQCHATAGRPRYGEDGVVRTEVGELGIACEACHGPGAEHVAANRDPLRRYALHYSKRADDAGDPTIVNPRRLAPERASEVCGQCHMVSTITTPAAFPDWNQHGPGVSPRRSLGRHARRPAERRPSRARELRRRPLLVRRRRARHRARATTTCARRRARSTDRCRASRATRCTSAPTMRGRSRHGPTTSSRRKRSATRRARGCHAKVAADGPAHTHHAAGTPGSGCTDCHMPYTTWGLLKAIRSHRIESPSVATALATGRPDACSLCHLDRPLAWSAERLEAWYGTPMPTLGDDDRRLAAAVRWLVAGDAGQRALVAWSMGAAPARAASARPGRRVDGGRSWRRRSTTPTTRFAFVAARTLAARASVTLGDYDFLAPTAVRARDPRRARGGLRRARARPAAAGRGRPRRTRPGASIATRSRRCSRRATTGRSC